MLTASAEPRVCCMCPREFWPRSSMHRVCSQRCATKLVKQKQAAEKVQDKARLESFKKIPQLIAVADKAFAAFIRERDRQAGHACISSGKPLDWSGNQVDAGHYRSRGAASHLRYNEDNCHAQSKHDNRHLAGNAVDYRIGLLARIGPARVEALEADNEVVKWTREGLREIAATYRQKLKELKRDRAAA